MLIPHLIGPPMSHWWLSSHWSLISLVPQCYTGYTVLIGPPSQWFPNVKLVTRFSLVPHLISPPMLHWLHSCHWSPISLVPQCHTGDTVLIGPPISLVPQCYTGYTVLIGPPSQWFRNVKLVTRFSLVPHFISPPMLHWLHSCHWSPISLVPQCNPGCTVLIALA